MKSRISQIKLAEKNKPLPGIYRWTDTEDLQNPLVVLFFGIREGIILEAVPDRKGNIERQLYDYNDERWELFKGEIAISN